MSAADETASGTRRGGPPMWFALLGIVGLVVAIALIGAQALGLGAGRAAPPATIPPTGEAAQHTRDLVAQTLGAQSFQVTDPRTLYRPGESPSLVDVPRRLLQAVLPSDPKGGYVVIYELPSADEADRVGRDFAAYLTSGPGAIQYQRDEQFVLRRIGQTLVFFPWSPSAATDPRTADLAGVLGGLGQDVPPS